jgi:pre-mRNA-splicing factor RBM22/SLT11
MPTDPNDPLAQQNIKDRYYGVNDPVANKMLRRNNGLPLFSPHHMLPPSMTISSFVHPLRNHHPCMNLLFHYYSVRIDNSSSIEPPEDKSITTLFLGNLSAEITEQDIRFVP